MNHSGNLLQLLLQHFCMWFCLEEQAAVLGNVIKQSYTGLDAVLADLTREFLSFPPRIHVLWSQTAKPHFFLPVSYFILAVFPFLFVCWILNAVCVLKKVQNSSVSRKSLTQIYISLIPTAVCWFLVRSCLFGTASGCCPFKQSRFLFACS